MYVHRPALIHHKMNKTSLTSSLLSAHCMILLAIILSFPAHTADDALI